MNLLISGTGSGLGRYLHRRFGGVAVTRETDVEALIEAGSEPFDAIVHCAVNAAIDPPGEAMAGYFEDNVLLTERLTRVAQRAFVYLSTVDVYAPTDDVHREDVTPAPGEAKGPYPVAKLISEAMVRACAEGPLVLRPTALLGRDTRPNSLIRMLTEDDCELTLAAESEFNYVLHADIGDFIALALEQGLTGVYNLASSGNVRLGELADRFGRSPRFGDFRYCVGRIDNAKAAALLPVFGRSSMETAEAFEKEIGAMT